MWDNPPECDDAPARPHLQQPFEMRRLPKGKIFPTSQGFISKHKSVYESVEICGGS
jgi:hypothetical protein